ncbi:MAG: twitch domain-containing radical SAM protein [Bacteroidetes bacterium]|nr:twitch domain-containing radical SAM protein [bacterium]NBP64482.1 twitch domain-containing radical SAM protein [Bacteroidota bacterium]
MTNDSICAAAFVHSHVTAKYERKLCCVAKPIEGMEKTTTEEYWNSDYLRDARLKMIAGEKLADCSFCYNYENMGVTSFRQVMNGMYPLDNIINKVTQDGTLESSPSYYDYRTITCNLQCVTCDDNHSSKHAAIARELLGRNSQTKVDLQYEKKLGHEIISGLHAKTVDNIYWAGGEPMLMATHWDVIFEMEKLLEDPEYTDYIKSVRMFYNTNMTKLYWKDHFIPAILSKFNVTLWASIDGVAETFEYCRDGAKWDTVRENWLIYKKHIPNTSVTAVLSAPVLMDIDRFMDFFESNDGNMFNHQYEPNDYKNLLDIRLYPDDIFHTVIDHAIDRIRRTHLGGKESTLEVLEMYRKQKSDFSNPDYQEIKNHTQRRDKFLKNSKSFEELLQQINKPTYNWYVGI